MNPFITNDRDEVRRAIRIIEAQLAKGMPPQELATVLQEELKTCRHLAQFFPGW